MEENFAKKFDKCPACGSPDRFCEQLTEVAKERGLARPEWNLFMDMRDGAVLDPNKAVIIPIGAKVPAYHIATDICMECGNVYAVELATQEAVIRAQEPPKNKGLFFGNPNLS